MEKWNIDLHVLVLIGLACEAPLIVGVSMKVLLLIAVVAGALAGCAMPARDSGRAPDQGASQTMGAMDRDGDRWMYDGQGGMRSWAGGDGPFFGARNR